MGSGTEMMVRPFLEGGPAEEESMPGLDREELDLPPDDGNRGLPMPSFAPDGKHPGDRGEHEVMLAALEHVVILPSGTKAKVTAGGLGKVVGLIAEQHPTNITMVHPMISEKSWSCPAGHFYNGPDAEAHGNVCHRCGGSLKCTQDANYQRESLIREAPIVLTVDGSEQVVQVYRGELPNRPQGRRVTFILLEHPIFERRTKSSIYPNPMTRRDVLRFFALWNQAVGHVLIRKRPTVYHCPDFHAAVAPWYARQELPNLRVLLCLHNAEYQGSISTDQLRGETLTEMAKIWNLDEITMAKHMIKEGRFNMLKPAVDYLLKFQKKRGIYAVSGHYAAECHSIFSIFWSFPCIGGLDNPVLADERPQLGSATLPDKKAEAKAAIQRQYGLTVDPEAKILVSLGRMVRQKGVDLIADVAPALLDSYPKAQLIVIGPPSDGFGVYAAQKLTRMLESDTGGRYQGRAYFKFEFVAVPADLKFAADFCLMPSRDEPFGYVDVEFAWHGALLIGAEAGGLGKVPGFYYRAQNRENLARLRRELHWAVRKAMTTDPQDLSQMQVRARQVYFPLDLWQEGLLKAYRDLNPLSIDELRETAPAPIEAEVEQPPTSTDFEAPVEFLKQELSEEELTDCMNDKIVANPNATITDILSSIGVDQVLKQEEKLGNSWGVFLTKSTLGLVRVHWLVCIGYVMSPVASTLGFVMCTEWGLRGAIGKPSEGAGVDPVALNMILFTVNAGGTALGTVFWAHLTKFVEPRKVMSASLLLQAPLNLAILLMKPHFASAIVVIFLYGFVSATGLLFVVFNFLLSVHPDMSRAAIRMGFLEVCRYVVMWLSSSYVFVVSPTSQAGSSEQPLPTSELVSLSPMVIVSVVFALIPGLLLLAAPGAYRDDRFPGWDFSNPGNNLSYIFLSLSDIVGAIGSFPATCYIMWWIAEGWSTASLVWIGMLIAVLMAAGTVLWSAMLSRASVHGFSFIIGFVLLLFPPSVLRAITSEEVSTWQNIGTSHAALVVSMISLLYEGIRSSASWTAKIKILNSNWRLLSFGTLVITVMNLVSAGSPWLSQRIAEKWYSASFISRNQKELADAVVVILVPVWLAQSALQILAAPHIHEDMGLVQRHSHRKYKVKDAIPIGFAMLTALGLAMLISVLDAELTSTPMYYDAVYKCGSDKNYPTCKLLVDETVDTPAVMNSWTYGLNSYGQSTTAKFNCRMRMLSEGGDTFVFWPSGRCMVQKCGSSEARQSNSKEPIVYPSEVWSRTCTMSGQNLVGVQLLEWRWEDVASECEMHLRSSGVDFVQVTPVTEHILGDSWAIRYQPVSYRLETRSGTRDEFVDMVARCRAVGIHVMVDVILNHMASPYVLTPKSERGKYCGQQEESHNSSTLPCIGWNGTVFANRQFLHGRERVDLFQRKDFHHYPGSDKVNCGIPPWNNNLHTCDLNGLPDLDTESVKVQKMQNYFLTELFEIGVTMLRLDAASFIYPQSIGHILQPIPWDYIVQEMYPDQLYSGDKTAEWAYTVGQVTDFSTGVWLTQTLLDKGFDSDSGGHWEDRSGAFKDWFRLGNWPSNDCGYKECRPPVRADKGLVFLDNHDVQRERWKPPEKMTPDWKPPPTQCQWDGFQIGSCRLNYKNGLDYSLATRFMLAWPAGDAARIMSSYAWEYFEDGPPGIRPDSRQDVTSHVTCRGTPTTSPVTDAYEADDNRFVCEHRWQGILGMARLRKQVGKDHPPNSQWQDDKIGVLSFNLGNVAFVALSRGYNIHTKQGNTDTFDLENKTTPLPKGTYCNLASELGPVPAPEFWSYLCTGGDPVVVGDDGEIKKGSILPNGMVAIHKDYTTASTWGEDGEDEDLVTLSDATAPASAADAAVARRRDELPASARSDVVV